MYVSIASVEYQIQRSLDQKFADRKAPYFKVINTLGDQVYQALIDQTPGLGTKLREIPIEYLSQISQLFVMMKGRRYSLTLSSVVAGPQGWANSYHQTAPEVPSTASVYQTFYENHMQIAAIDKEQNELMTTIRATMRKCKSFNQLVKVWPSALNYVDAHTKDKYHEKAAKGSSTELPVLDDNTKVLLTKVTLLT